MKRVAVHILAFVASIATSAVLSVQELTAPWFGDGKPGVHQTVVSGSVGRPLTRPDSELAARERARRRNELRAREAGTYIGEILLGRDSALARWPERQRPLAVWISPSSEIEDWAPVLVRRVRSAFEEWNSVLLPVSFDFVDDSSAADIHVMWTDRFDEPISGRTRWERNDSFWITYASVTLAVHHHQGAVLDPAAMQALALHEIGHLIGLDHTTDVASVMAPRVRVRELSPADRATARLLYELPPGAIR